jgi:hypothetical protein
MAHVCRIPRTSSRAPARTRPDADRFLAQIQALGLVFGRSADFGGDSQPLSRFNNGLGLPAKPLPRLLESQASWQAVLIGDRWRTTSFRAHCLQPNLDQAADGFGAIQFPALTCDPFVDALDFVLGPLRVWARSERILRHAFFHRDGRRNLGEVSLSWNLSPSFPVSRRGTSTGRHRRWLWLGRTSRQRDREPDCVVVFHAQFAPASCRQTPLKIDNLGPVDRIEGHRTAFRAAQVGADIVSVPLAEVVRLQPAVVWHHL